MEAISQSTDQSKYAWYKWHRANGRTVIWVSELEIHTDKPLFNQDNDLTNSSGLCLFFLTEIEKVQKDEDNEDEKFIDVVINKNMKLGQKILIPVKQFPKVSTTKLFFQCIMW